MNGYKEEGELTVEDGRLLFSCFDFLKQIGYQRNYGLFYCRGRVIGLRSFYMLTVCVRIF